MTHANGMSIDIFQTAKKAVNRSLIENLFPGGEWKSKEYWICSPLRTDKTPGSFSINESGVFNDFASKDSGDLIDLVSRCHNINKIEAAKLICEKAGVNISTASQREKRIEYKYINADGSTAFNVVRVESAKGKNVFVPGGLPERYRTDSSRPLYKLPDLIQCPDMPVLIVEGEKCASIQVDEFTVLTWSGGSQAYNKTDFSPLYGREVYLWRDNDQPGKAAMQAIGNILLENGSTVYQINIPEGKPQGWDIADAAAEGEDIQSIILKAEPFTFRATAESPAKEDKSDNRFLDAKTAKDALSDRPVIPWIVADLITPQSITILIADSGQGKTWTCLDLAVCFAEGKKWLGHATTGGAVFYLDEENGESPLADRLEMVIRGHEGNENTPIFYKSMSALDLQDQSDISDMKEMINAYNIKMLFLDALVEVKGDAKENESDGMGVIFQNLRHIAIECDCAIVILHHSTKPGDYRGSSAIKAGCDQMLKLTKKGNSLFLQSMKMRHSAPVEFTAQMKFTQLWKEPDPRSDSFILYGGEVIFSLSKTEQEVIDYLERHGRVQRKILCKETSSNTKNVLNSMVEKNLIFRLWKDEDDKSPIEYAVTPEIDFKNLFNSTKSGCQNVSESDS